MRNVFVVILAVVAITFLCYLRMIPGLNNEVEFRSDRAFNFRMTAEIFKFGDLPETDRLSTYPIGKKTKAFLPTGMYYACAYCCALVNRLTPLALNRFILHFCSLAGSLIFLPIFFISYEVYRSRTIAFVTALTAGMVPAYLHRTMCYWYRYEVMAIPLLFASLLFFIKAAGASQDRKAYAHAITSVLFLCLAFLVWRMSVIFVVGYMTVLCFFLMRRRTFGKTPWVTGTLIIICSFFFMKIGSGPIVKGIPLHYWLNIKAAIKIALDNIGIAQTFTNFEALMHDIKELKSIPIGTLFDKTYLSWIAPFIALYYIFYFISGRRDIKRGIIAIFLGFFLILTLLYMRNKIFLGPLAALAMGESILFAVQKKRLMKYLLLALIVIAMTKTGVGAQHLMKTRHRNTKVDKSLRPVVQYINKNLPEDAVVHGHWVDGYFIQTYCNRATVTDGLLESPEILKRIIAFSKLLYAHDMRSLYEFSKGFGATHLLIPTNRKRTFARYAGYDYNAYYVKGRPAQGREWTVLDKLMYRPERNHYFKLLYKNSKYRLFEIKKRPDLAPDA